MSHKYIPHLAIQQLFLLTSSFFLMPSPPLLLPNLSQLSPKDPTKIHSFAPVFILKKYYGEGFPGVSVVKNLPDNAGDMFDPWSRKIPHASKQLSPSTTTTEPVL